MRPEPQIKSLSGALLLKFDNACVTHLGEVAEKTRAAVAN